MLKELLLSPDPVAMLRFLDTHGGLRESLPLVADLRIQDSKSHLHKDNLNHSLGVLENAIALETAGPDLILRTAALLHDVGKPATRSFQGNKATFHNHETVGASLVRKFLPQEGYTPEEVELVANLVANHMRSFNFSEEFWTASSVRRLREDVPGEEQVERLFVLFKADVTTKHSGRRETIWAKVDTMARKFKEVEAADARKALRPALNGHQVMELTGLTPGPTLGKLMTFLNSDEGINLTREEAETRLKEMVAQL